MEKIPNETIPKTIKEGYTIPDNIRTKQLRWWGHFQRIEERRLPNKILNWIPKEGKEEGREIVEQIEEEEIGNPF